MSKLIRVSFKVLDLFVIFMLTFGSPMSVLAAPQAQDPTPPTIVSDQADYNPGQLVTLTGTGWTGDTTITILVNDDQGQQWYYTDTVAVVSDGSITDSFTLPTTFIAQYFVTATGSQTGRVATTSFTDANPSADLDQCANDQFPSPSTDGCNVSTNPSPWVNGNVNGSKATYFEGDSLPYRMRFDNLSLSSHTVIIEWDTTKSSKHALDYITTFNQTVANANPCLDVSGCNPNTFSTFPIPADPQVTGAGVTPIAGNFTLYGGTITAVSAYSYPNGAGFTGDKSARITITFTASQINPVLAWAGHIASRQDWGQGNAAVNVDGSPYHTRLIALNGSGGNQDRSLSADAVIFPGSITIIKDAVPDDAQDFGFTTTGGLNPASFTLDDDADGTNTNTQLYSNILVTSNTGNDYTVVEGTVSGWTLSFNGAGCTTTSPNGGSASGNAGTKTVTINLREGENVTCTFINTRQAATLTLVKTVVNDNGGSATEADFQAYIDGGAVPWNSAQSVSPGSHTASESNLPGYTASSWGGDCAADGSVSLSAGQNKTCTITNDDQQAYVIVEKVVINDNGGSAEPDDFNLTLDGNATTSGALIPVNPDTYTAGETLLSGYTFEGFSGDCDDSGSVTVALGETKTCTLTNNDQGAFVIVEKVVINDNGGSAEPDDFNLTLDGNATTSGALIPVNPGTYTAGETLLSGYTFEGFSGDCDDSGSVTVAPGETKTCTLTNNDQQAYVIVEKVVINDNGGSAEPDDFNLTLDGNATTSGALIPVNPGTYTAGETLLSGYTFEGFSGDCDDSGSVTVALGETKTCTLTNNDQQAYVTVIKLVDNDNGGPADPDDFNLTLEGNPVSSGVTVPVDPGTYTAGETLLDGYTFTGFSGDCDAHGDVTVALGESKTCYLSNNDNQSYVIVEKVVINDNGGSADPDDFNLTLDGNATTSGALIPVDPGTYTAGETLLSGYTFEGFSGDCDSNGDVTVALGETKTCTLTNNDQQSYLIVEKVVVNDNGGSADPDDFNLTLDGNATTSGALIPVDPGIYTAAETQLDGYTFDGFSGDCDDNGSVTVALGETKTCTLTNDDQQAYITVVKVVNNNHGGTAAPNDFDLTLEGNAVSSGVAVAVNPGTYTAGETQLSGYTFDGFSGDCDSSGDVTVALGESKTCTLTNSDQQAYITVVKVVHNNHGGTAAPNDFNLTLEGNAVSSGVAVPVNPGTYTAGETLLAGYTFDGFSGDCNTSGDTTVALGQSKTCTLTNSDQQSYITVVKIVTNNNGGTAAPNDFNLTLEGSPVSSGVAVPVNPGTYTAGETLVSGYSFVGFSGDCDSNGDVTVALGQSKTCTLTNDDIQPTLKLVKTVTNDNGGTKTVSDFPLFISGVAATSGTAYGKNAGTYTASETSQYGYTASAWGGDCAANGSVSLSVGDNKTCTITNNDNPGTIIVEKIIKPAGGLTSFAFQTTGDNGVNALPDYAGFSLAGGNQNSQTLDAGSYTVKELVPLGWTLTGIGGGLPVSGDAANTQYYCTVSGSGGSTGIGDLNTQTAAINLKNGDTVKCVFENTGLGATRTQGFWATHLALAKIAWEGGSGYGHTFPGVTGVAGIGDKLICGRPVSALGMTTGSNQLMGGFWSDISKTSTGAKRSAIEQARMQLLQQLLAAELNASAFGSVPSGGSAMFAQWENALCNGNQNAITTAKQQAASFNTAGDSSTFTPGTSADSRTGRFVADIVFWNTVKP